MKNATKSIDELKDYIEELEEQLEVCREADPADDPQTTPFRVGHAYFIRTVTYHMTGKVKQIKGNFLVLKDAAWIADSGRFRQAIVEGILSEVEPVDDEVYVNINSITDAFVWKHKLPREQK